MTELLLGIDIGTASSKGVVCTPSGEIIARATRPHRASLPRPGWLEHDALDAWWGGVRALCRELLPGREASLAGVAISGIGPCVVPCDAAGEPLRPAILYGSDTRSEAEVVELTELLGDETIRARCGSSLSTQALGPKLLWLRRHEPEVWAATHRWHMASSFAVERLTGTWALDHHSASQCDPLYDLERAAWIEEWCDEILGELALPPLSWPAEVVGMVHREGAEATGIPEGTPVVAGTIDAWAEALSAGVRARGDAMVMYGSTMFFIAVAEGPTTAPGIWTTAGIDPGTRTLAAGTATSGSVTSWLAELVGRGHDELLARAGQVAAGSEGLLLLPFFAGERTPVPDPRARGVLAGLTLRHGPEHLYRAVLEGTAYGARRNLEALGVDDNTRLVAVGGGAGAELWPQIVSDVTGLSQLVPEETIGAAYGDALLAAEGVGLAPSGHTWARPARTLDPDPAVRPRYDELYGAWLALAEATASAQHLLAAFDQDAS